MPRRRLPPHGENSETHILIGQVPSKLAFMFFVTGLSYHDFEISSHVIVRAETGKIAEATCNAINGTIDNMFKTAVFLCLHTDF